MVPQAALVTGRRAAGPKIQDAETYTFPQSLDAMGFELRDSGFHIVLSKDVPRLIRAGIRPVVDAFLRQRNLRVEDMAAFILHPGGQKLLAYLEEQVGLCRCDTEYSWDVLRRFGNLSSATILFILHDWLTKRTMASGAYGLAAAFGQDSVQN
jgi:alkylresorcinol/alkylpyrone synthase